MNHYLSTFIAGLLHVPLAILAQDNAEELNQLGSTAYFANCNGCHQGIHPGTEQAPKLAQLKKFSADRIRAALTTGRMRRNAIFLTKPQLEALIYFLAGPPPAAAAAASAPSNPPAAVQTTEERPSTN